METTDLNNRLNERITEAKSIALKPHTGEVLTLRPKRPAYTEPQDAPVSGGGHWADYYVNVAHRTRISDELESSGHPRHYRIAGVRLTEHGDYIVVRTPDGHHHNIDVKLILEDALMTRL